MREEGYRYREIAVIASDLNTYADSLEKACERYEIPVFMDHKKSILLNSFVEYLRSLLVMVEQNYTYESVFRYLRTGLCGFTRDEVDRPENYCLALDLKGFKKWDQVRVRKTPMTKKRRIGRTESAARAFCGKKLTPLHTVLKKRRKTVKRDYTRSL